MPPSSAAVGPQWSRGSAPKWGITVNLIPVSVVIPTWNRAAAVRRTLECLAAQSVQSARAIVVDASEDQAARNLSMAQPVSGLNCEVVWLPAQTGGAASQRTKECGNVSTRLSASSMTI